MTPWGWGVLILSWGVLTVVTTWCFVKVLQAPFVPKDPPTQTPHNT